MIRLAIESRRTVDTEALKRVRSKASSRAWFSLGPVSKPNFDSDPNGLSVRIAAILTQDSGPWVGVVRLCCKYQVDKKSVLELQACTLP